MRLFFIILCAVSIGISSAGAQQSKLDRLITKFERSELSCEAALDSFEVFYKANPNSGLAALYVSRAYARFGSIGAGCADAKNVDRGIERADSELHYLRVARQLDPNVCSLQGFTISQMTGHAYGGKALWHL